MLLHPFSFILKLFDLFDASKGAKGRSTSMTNQPKKCWATGGAVRKARVMRRERLKATTAPLWSATNEQFSNSIQLRVFCLYPAVQCAAVVDALLNCAFALCRSLSQISSFPQGFEWEGKVIARRMLSVGTDLHVTAVFCLYCSMEGRMQQFHHREFVFVGDLWMLRQFPLCKNSFALF